MVRAAFRLLPLVPVRGQYGNWMLSVPDNTTVRSLIGTYGPVFACVDRLREGMAFLDIGANAGVFSLFASNRVGQGGRVVAFEPSPEIFRLLVRNIELNKANQVIPINAAIGPSTAMVGFDPASPGHSGTAHLAETGTIEVVQIGGRELEPILSVIVEKRNIIVKIDVEGAELRVLEGLAPFLRSARVAAIVVEVDGSHLARFGATEDGLYQLMAELGFVAENDTPRGSHYDQVFTRQNP